jgi:hypothetical protein
MSLRRAHANLAAQQLRSKRGFGVGIDGAKEVQLRETSSLKPSENM